MFTLKRNARLMLSIIFEPNGLSFSFELLFEIVVFLENIFHDLHYFFRGLPKIKEKSHLKEKRFKIILLCNYDS